MFLPEYVQKCMDMLEGSGFCCYAVGGCVRDSLLQLVPHDYDLCTDALPEQIRAVFSAFPLVLAGEKHGTIGVILESNVVEITTFRTEGNYTDNRHPGWVTFVKDIRGDLARRDFTVNAMAWSPTRGLVDPFGGQKDLSGGILRTVGDASARFSEDALRILRGVRFSVTYRLLPEAATLQAMYAQAPLLENIAQERIFDELCKLLPFVNADDLLRFAPILTQVIPELAPAVGFQQCNSHHAYDIFTHSAHVTAAVPPDLSLRWAALLHDIGKVSTFTLDPQGNGHFYGHAAQGALMADEILLRLKAPNALRDEVTFLIRHHMTPLTSDRKQLRRALSKWGHDCTDKLLHLQQADFTQTGVCFEPFPYDAISSQLEEIMQENSCLTVRDLAINGHDLMALGLSGRAIGTLLEQLLAQVLDEELPNESAALLAAARRTLL